MRLLLILPLTCILLMPHAGRSQTKSENLFYMVDRPASFKSFKENIDQISMICPQNFQVSKEGVLTGTMDQRVLALARENGVQVVPLIVNKGFDQELLHEIVSNPSARSRSIEMMLEYAKIYHLDGWQFDLEGLHIADKEEFTQYYRETADAFKKAGLQLSAALVHRYQNVGGPSAYTRYLYEDWRAGYAAKELSEIGDFVSIMTYDQHTRRTPPGPVSSPEWMARVVEYLLAEGVSPDRLSLGIPNYSVHWYADYEEEKGGFTSGRQVGYEMVEHLLGKYGVTPEWHESGCNYAFWDNGGVFEYLFIEDAKSLRPKLDLLKKYKLRGISVWVIGSEDPAFWDVLKQELVKR